MRKEIYKNNNRHASNAGMPQFKTIVNLCVMMMISVFTMFTGCKKDNPLITPAPTAVTPPVTKPIVYPFMYKLGVGTNVTTDYASVGSLGGLVFDPKLVYAHDSARISIDNLSTQGTEVIAGENALSYAKSLSGKLKASSGLGLFKASISYFDSLSFRSDFIYSSYTLLIRQKRIRVNATAELLKQYLSDQFRADSKSLTPAELVRQFGTHAITDLITGGKFVALYRARTSSTDRRSAATAGLSFAVKKLFDLDISGGGNSSYSATNTDQLLYYNAVAGYSNTPLVGEVTLGPTVPNTIKVGTWQQTVTPENAVLIDFGSSDGLINIADLIPDAAKAEAVRAYIKQYLIDNQVKMVDAPPPVFIYYDATNTNWCLSVDDVPTMYGRLGRQGPAFRAYAGKAEGTIPITQYYNPSNGDFIYSKDPKASLAGYNNMGTVFWAFDKPQPGTTPVFEFLYNAKIHKHIYYGHYYSTTNQLPGTQDWAYTGLAFYAYSL